MTTKKFPKIPKRETVKLSAERVAIYRKMSEQTLMPMSYLIERAMDICQEDFQKIANEQSAKLDNLAIQLTGKKLVRA